MRVMGMLLGVLLSAAPAIAAPLKPELAGVGFLIGNWRGSGKVPETGGTARGLSHISVEAGGAVLLRRDHTDQFDAAGKPAGGFDQIMLIYPEGGTLHADYSDGTHVIHYVSATIVPDHSVVFASAPGAGPTFRLSYELKTPDSMEISFGMVPPGQTAIEPIAVGTVRRLGR